MVRNVRQSTILKNWDDNEVFYEYIYEKKSFHVTFRGRLFTSYKQTFDQTLKCLKRKDNEVYLVCEEAKKAGWSYSYGGNMKCM
jgi:hypothetical protein